MSMLCFYAFDLLKKGVKFSLGVNNAFCTRRKVKLLSNSQKYTICKIDVF